MEIIVTTIYILLLLGLLLTPIIILRFTSNSNGKFKFLKYLTFSLAAVAIFAIIYGWGTHTSTIILLKHYNAYAVNPDSNSGQVYYEKVLPENIERVKVLDRKLMGIGWPLKSIFLFVLFSPYLFVIYSFEKLISKITIRKRLKTQTE